MAAWNFSLREAGVCRSAATIGSRGDTDRRQIVMPGMSLNSLGGDENHSLTVEAALPTPGAKSPRSSNVAPAVALRAGKHIRIPRTNASGRGVVTP
jgi:hypothetical protein